MRATTCLASCLGGTGNREGIKNYRNVEYRLGRRKVLSLKSKVFEKLAVEPAVRGFGMGCKKATIALVCLQLSAPS